MILGKFTVNMGRVQIIECHKFLPNSVHKCIITWDLSWQSHDTEEETDKESYSKGQHDV